MDADERDLRAPSPSARASLARVALTKRAAGNGYAPPVRVVEVEAQARTRCAR